MWNNIVDLIKNSNSQIQEVQTTTADMQLSTTELKKKKSQVRGGKKKDTLHKGEQRPGH